MPRCKSTPTRRGHGVSRNISNKTPKTTNTTKTGRYRPGSNVLREIRFYQQSKKLLISKLSFKRLVMELAHEYNTMIRYEAHAILILQRATEDFLTEFLSEVNNCAAHDNRITIMQKDVELAKRIRGVRA